MTEAVENTKTAEARLLIVGPPGAGKGTQAKFIAGGLGIPDVSTGDIFRDNIKNETPLGLKVKAITASGAYVPDEVTNAIVADRLSAEDTAGGFLLDGYPRTAGQVEFLDAYLAEHGTALDAVIRLVADTDVVVGRLLARAQEQGRDDDNEDVIRHRLDVYHTETEPIIELYRQRGLLVEVDGLGTIDEVAARVHEALEARGIRRAGGDAA
ncbi:MAG TPA: adenylate kinase [Gryllotalpicola sp.]